MEGKVISLIDNVPHRVSEVICVSCKRRWIAVRPVECKLADIECPKCGNQKFVIETGEQLTEEYED